MPPSIYFHPANCGMRDLVIGYGSREPKDVLLEISKYCVSPRYVSMKIVSSWAPIGSHIIFSQACSKTAKPPAAYGEHLANYIASNHLGVVHQSSSVLNTDHGPNYITAFIWTPDWEAFEAWWKGNAPAEKSQQPLVGTSNPLMRYHQPCQCVQCNKTAKAHLDALNDTTLKAIKAAQPPTEVLPQPPQPVIPPQVVVPPVVPITAVVAAYKAPRPRRKRVVPPTPENGVRVTLNEPF